MVVRRNAYRAMLIFNQLQLCAKISHLSDLGTQKEIKEPLLTAEWLAGPPVGGLVTQPEKYQAQDCEPFRDGNGSQL